MVRSKVVKCVVDYLSLSANYSGGIHILPEIGDQSTQPPYAVVRIGEPENMFPGSGYEFWTGNLLVGAFHDADITTAAEAQSASNVLFQSLEKSTFVPSCSAVLAVSCWQRETSDFSINENHWQTVAGFKFIISPMG